MTTTSSSSIGPYRILRQLGRGGMGTVYLCQHRDLGIRRAVKVLNTDGSTTMLERFKREAQVEAVLEHPHILKAEHYDLDQQGRPYVVMSYLGDDDGPMDLDRYLTEHGGTLDSATTARLVSQILDGLAHAHEQGLVHRDLKPANVLIEEGEDGPTARIADFGLVRLVGEAAFRDRIHTSISQSLSLGSAPTLVGVRAPDEYSQTIPAGSAGTSTQALIGTWSYMAPEQKRMGGDVDHRADLYAAGLLAYRMLLGKLPEGMPKSPGQVDPSLAVWDEWLARMLEGDVDARFQNAADALATLPGRIRVRTRSSRKPFRIVLGVVAVAVLAVAGWQLTQQFSGMQGTGGTARQSQPTTIRYDTAADLVGIEAEVRALRQKQPAWPDLGLIKQAWADGENAFEMAVANQDRAAWQAAGLAYERAKAAYKRAVMLDGQADEADDLRSAFHERYDPITWFEHDAIAVAVTEINELDARAMRHWNAGEFTDAKSVWDEAGQKVATAEALNAAATKADASRQAWDREYGSVDPPWYSAVADDVDRLVERASSAESDFNDARFAEAASAWQRLVEELEPLKQQHEKARADALTKRRSWESALGTIPEPLYDKIRPEVSQLRTRADTAEAAFEKGRFDEAAAAWGEHTTALKGLLEQHTRARNKAEQAKAGYEAARSKTPSRWIEDMSVSSKRDEADRAGREADAAHGEARFDASASSYTEAAEALAEAVALHDSAVASLMEGARRARSGGRYAESITKLDEAEGFADPAEIRSERIATYLSWAEASNAEPTREEARDAVTALLELEPGHARGLALREQILALFGPKRGDTKTVDLGNGETMEFVWIEPGRFEMGSPSSESGRYDDEGPRHGVTIGEGFWLGRTEVTQGQYRAVMGKNPSFFKGDDTLPVEQVSWNAAKSFCERVSRATGLRVRLPSESEWEFACRAGTTTAFNTGSTINTDQANYNGNYTYGNGRKGVYREKTVPVGSFKPNAWGLYDMPGNVYEWCEDVWHDSYQGAPTDGSAWTRGGDQGHRVLRGGSWNYDPRNCRSAYRYGVTPDGTNDDVGFRVCLD